MDVAMRRERDCAIPSRPHSGSPALASPALLAAALDAAATPALVVSAEDGTVVHANRALLATTGYTAAELVGRASRVLFQGECALADFQTVRATLAQGRTWTGDARFLCKDGEVRCHEVRAAAVGDGSGAVTYFVALCHDATELHSQARLLLTDRMVSAGTLAAGVAHEINNPLAFLLANLEFAADKLGALSLGDPAVAEARAALCEAREGAERVRDIVRDLKTFSRGDDGARGPVDLERVMESSIKLAWNEIRHRARLVRDYGRVPPVEAEEARLVQVFLNLILNAVQAIPEGEVHENEIRVATRVGPDGRVVAEVRDSGEGIPDSVRPRLFEPFFTTKPVGVGTGLGLYICRHVVVGMGGEIEVESARGAGSLFRVLFPPAARRRPEPPVAAGNPIARGRVLVVDDEPMIGAILTRVLSMHDVVSVRTAREALARITAGESYDVVLCDLLMPEMSGMDLHAELAERAPEATERMVFLTGGIYSPHARAFAERVPNAFVEKPFDAASLRALVAQRIEGLRSSGR